MRTFNTILLSSISLTALISTAVSAQTVAASPGDTTPQKTQEGTQARPAAPTNAEGQPAATTPRTANGGAIVVTGSRIRRDTFSAPQNIDVITRDDTILAGTRSTSDVLQSASITSGTSQISGSFLGYLSDNGQGANTVGLRGLGSSRTLVLLNGRRLAPAGVGPQLVAADLNVLPTAVVQRIEVLREGASSIYGSDAIAGVINVITDTSINGITLDAYTDQPLYAVNGAVFRGSITAGKTFSRGHIMGSFEYRNDQGLNLGSRPDTQCPRELAYVNSHEVGQTVVGGTQLRCFPYQRGGGGLAAGSGVSNFFPSAGKPIRASFPGYNTGNYNIFGPPAGVAFNGNDFNNRPQSPRTVLDSTFLTPLRTLTGYVNGSYELDALGDAELYGEALYVRRKTKQFGPDRPDWSGSRVNNCGFGGSYCSNQKGQAVEIIGPTFAGIDLRPYGYPVSPFFPVSWSKAGMYQFYPFWSPNRIIETKQQVDFWRGNAGLRGNLGIGDWRYDGNVQLSHTKGRDDRQTIIAQRLTNVLVTTPAPSGTPGQYITTAIPGQLNAGQQFTCASNVTNGAYNGGTCQPVNIFDPNVLVGGAITDEQFNYLYPWINYTKTRYHQETFALNFDGSLFPLQGGEVKGAVGFEYRHDHIDDVPGPERQADQLLYYGVASETKGSDAVKEAFAEIDAPIFKDRPFFNALEVDASARYTDYRSYGHQFTYHIGAQWAPIKALRFRGNYGTNFRAPNLYEQYVASQVGFYGNSVDPCVNFAASTSPGSNIYKNCLTELTATLGSQAAALAFNPPGGSIPVTTTGGKGVLKAETAKTWGVGAVFTMPRRIADFSLAVDYFNVKVKGEVNTLGNLILNFCYDSTTYPNNPYCAFIGPRKTVSQVTDPLQAGSISGFQNPYLNIAQQNVRGIDFDARYATPLVGGQLIAQLQATRMLGQETEFYPGGGLNEYNGTLGYPGNGAGPKWTASLDARFKTGLFTFHWGVQYIGPQSSNATANSFYLTDTGAVCTAGSAGCFQAHLDLHVPKYFEHTLSMQVLWPKVGQFTIGMNNVFNRKPPIISADTVNNFPRYGNFFANGGYDYRGRSVFINATRSFFNNPRVAAAEPVMAPPPPPPAAPATQTCADGSVILATAACPVPPPPPAPAAKPERG